MLSSCCFQYFQFPTVQSVQWGTINAGGLPAPWTFTYPTSFKNLAYAASLVRKGGGGAYSEIINELTLSYLTWIDKDHNNETVLGDTIIFIIIGR